ncbi:hypothetical protein [uncultured Roseobacter sp.]|uniref:hypothetical protein n=1 Tax=uncultured Roseobacter sp. TaxID=114847 RepID=UPI0026043878|nr:hypothetical protein [uncultured Roseobacter sp.]
MFDSIASSVSCLIGIECPLQGAGGAAPPGQLIVTTIAASSIALVVSVWNDAIKTYLKGTLTGLLAATLLIFAALAVPSVWLACAAGAVLVLSALFYKRLRGKSLRVNRNTKLPLPKLVLPAASMVYLTGAGVITVLDSFRPPPVLPAKTVAFFAPSKLVGTSLEDQQLALDTGLLAAIDLGAKERISAALSNLDIEIHPSLAQDEHNDFRKKFGQTSLANLDNWLSKQEKLNALSQRVDIALVGSAKIQSVTGRPRELVVRAYVHQRIPEQERFDRVKSGKSIVARGTVRNSNELMLVLAVRLAVKLVDELSLPPLGPEQQVQIWSDLSLLLQEQMELFLEGASEDELRPESIDRARAAIHAAGDCKTSKCALEIAAALEDLLLPETVGDRQISTAVAAYEAAIGNE